jgi:hypothetical protein
MEIEEIELDDKQFEAACKEAGLSKSLTRFTQKISDQRVSEGIKTFQKNKGDKTDQERIEELEKEISGLKSGIAKGDLDTQIKKELKAQDLSEDLIKYIRCDDPDKVGESVKALKEDITNLQQKEIDIKLKEGGIPAKGDTSGKVDSAIEKFVESKNKGQAGGPFEGKETPETKGD